MRWGDGSQVRLCTGPRKALGHGQQQGMGEEGGTSRKWKEAYHPPARWGN